MQINTNFLNKITLLYVEDSKIQRVQTLKKLEPLFKEIIIATDGLDGLEQYKKNKDNIDVIITDIVMPNMNGLDMIRLIRDINPKIPCILTTSVIESNVFVEAIDLHISHYAVKPFDYTKLITQIQNASISIFQQKIIEEKVHESEQLLYAINDVAIISKTNTKGIITYTNSQFCKVTGYDPQELIGCSHNIVRHPDTDIKLYNQLWETISSGKRWVGIIKNKAKDGTSYYVKSYIFPLYDENLEISEYIGIKFLMTQEEESKRDLQKVMMHNISTQKMTMASVKKENELLQKRLDDIFRTTSLNKSESNFSKERLSEEKNKHQKTKDQLKVTEEKLKQLQNKYDNFLEKVAR